MRIPFKTLPRPRSTRGVLSRTANGSRHTGDAVVPARLYRQKFLLVLVTIIILSAVMSVHLMPDKISLHIGDISPTAILAQRSVIYVDTTATTQAMQAARLSTPAVYDQNERSASNATRITNEVFDRLTLARSHLGKAAARTGELAQAAHALEIEFGSTISEPQMHTKLSLSTGVYQRLHDTTVRLIADAMEREIKDQSASGVVSPDLRHARHDVVDSAHETLTSEPEVRIAALVAERALQPNYLLNKRKTDAAGDAAARSVQPVFGRIIRGDTIIAAGDRVTQEHLDKFQGLGLLDPRLEIQAGAAICILAAAMVLLVSVYIRRSLTALYGDMRRLCLLSFIVLMSVLGLKVGATMLGLQFTGGQFGYLAMMSVSAAGMLVSVLLDTQLAVLVVALLSVLSGLIMNHEIRFTVMTLMSSLVGIGCCRPARTRSNLLSISVILSCANLALAWLMGMLMRDSLAELMAGSCWAVLMGFAATSIYWFGVLALEKPFGILTHQTLLEMSASDRPLLQQLCAAAPGTYAHSIMVGTLAEAGAQAIGADSLLCRVAGYYHDIGKMRRPEFFVENQRNGNVHGRLSPSLSAIFITAHVRDGLEMAADNKLPYEIREIIASHHGTTLIGFFYHQALMDCGGSDEAAPGLEERFRYPGPKPKTREAAVVMLADSIEAATRTLEKPRKDSLEAEISRIVRAKIEDGQFDDCSITFKDIKGISDAFLHVLEAMMHGRVSYPKLAAAASIEAAVNGASVGLAPAAEMAYSSISDPDMAPAVGHATEAAGAGLKTAGARNFQEPEEFYASFGDEQADQADSAAYSRAAASGKSPAAVRASLLRGSQRSTDG